MFDIIKFIFKSKKIWLLPIVLALLFVGVFVIFTSSTALAPMIYAIF